MNRTNGGAGGGTMVGGGKNSRNAPVSKSMVKESRTTKIYMRRNVYTSVGSNYNLNNNTVAPNGGGLSQQ